MRERLKLNLQHFADDAPTGSEDSVNDKDSLGGDEPKSKVDDVLTDVINKDDDDVKMFTQAELDSHIRERLERSIAKSEADKERIKVEAEREKLKESEEFKELAETYRLELEAVQSKVIDNEKEKALIKAGYDNDQVTRFVKFVSGDNEAEILESVGELIKDVPPKKSYADPGTGNSSKGKPATKDSSEVGKTAFDRIKSKIRK